MKKPLGFAAKDFEMVNLTEKCERSYSISISPKMP
jgi:hypothetical protein